MNSDAQLSTTDGGFLDAAGRSLAHMGEAFSELLFAPGSTFSIWSLIAALAVSVGVILWKRRGKRMPGAKLLARALFPAWAWTRATMRADLMFMVLNVALIGGLVGWMLIAATAVDAMIRSALGAGPALLAGAPLLREAAMTLILFLAYEFAYWIDHWLKHRVPFFWEFHRVHHTAEALTPFTVFRIHPVDGVMFHNIMALVIGSSHALAGWLLGASPGFTLSGMNVLLVVFVYLFIHLQHSHVALGFTGTLGKLFLSPVHHQIHHSENPAHYGSNLGSCLAIWDWMFGTLTMPVKGERLTFGAGAKADPVSPHSMTGSLAYPFVRAWQTLRPKRAAKAAEAVS